MANSRRRRGRSSTHGGGASHTELNLTPLMDVLLVLLVIFMVTAPMMQGGIPVNLPSGQAEQGSGGVAGPDPIDVSLSAEGAIYIGDQLVAIDQLVEVIKAQVAKNQSSTPDGPEAIPQVRVRADKNLPYFRVIEVFDVLSRQQFKVILVTQASAGQAERSGPSAGSNAGTGGQSGYSLENNARRPSGVVGGRP
jgi:biopolymer transport protein TolR